MLGFYLKPLRRTQTCIARGALLKGVILLMPLALAACDQNGGDPFSRPGMWRATNDNDANLQAMVADPKDLVEGRGTNNALGTEAALPARRVLTGARPPLPVLSTTLGIASAPPQQQSSGPQLP
jgi:hypothetical protein